MEMEVDDDHLEDPCDDKDFIYVEDGASDTSTGSTEQKSLSSFDTCKKSEGSETSSYSEVHPPEDLEPRMGASEHGIDVSKLVEEAQLEDTEHVEQPVADVQLEDIKLILHQSQRVTVTDHPLSEPEEIASDDFLPDYYSEENTTRDESPKKLSQASNATLQDENEQQEVIKIVGEDLNCSATDDTDGSKDECELFHHITYLGSSTIYKPVNELELKRAISIHRENTDVQMDITLAISISPCGCIRLVDPESTKDIAMYNIESICYWGKGDRESPDKDCFAFNIGHGKEDPVFHCHVFRSGDEAIVFKILRSLSTTIKKDQKRQQDDFPHRELSLDWSNLTFKFNILVDIWEEDVKGVLQTVARDKTHFKLRRQLQRKVVLVIRQLTNNLLKIQKCCGLLLAQGRDVSESDFHTLEDIQLDERPSGQVVISGHWDPNVEEWKLLNTDVVKASFYITIAADLIFQDLKEPVRVHKEVKVRIFPKTEKFWSPTKPRIQEEYILQLKENVTEQGEKFLVKEYLKSAAAVAKEKSLTSGGSGGTISSIWRGSFKGSSRDPATNKATETEDTLSGEEEDEDDEPLLSGSGEVAHTVCTEEELQSWKEVLQQWKESDEARPEKVLQLVRKGIPPSLRGEVWLKMAGFDEESEVFNSYSDLIQKDSPQEQVILWDVTRTFPGNDYFKVPGGEGQNALYHISKAYSCWDEEVGYCQGLSFLIAAFLLNVSEQQAYCLLVNVMFEYHHRDLFSNGFEMLHQSFYVLDRLMEDYMHDLSLHFQSINVEVHMFASQWLLTMFTAKFPLSIVNYFIDIILCDGCDVMFQIALALLQESRKELLLLDFEGTLKYFRVNLPKKYMNEKSRQDLFTGIYSFKVSRKRLEKYKSEYDKMQEEMASREDPVARLQREHRRMQDEWIRLERENDSLAFEIVTTQVTMQEKVTELEEKVNNLIKEKEIDQKHILDCEEEIERLKTEEGTVKELWRESTIIADNEKASRDRIIEDYKQILTNLEARNEKERKEHEAVIDTLKNQINTCEGCTTALLNGSPNAEAEEDGIENTASCKGASLLTLLNKDNMDSQQQIRNIEAELIQAKVALAEEKNRADELELRLHNVTVASEKPWYKNFSIHPKR